MNSAAFDFHNALIKLLKPLVRFALKRGLKIQEMVFCLKRAAVLVSEEELHKKNIEINTSRLSVLTGLQRKEVKQLIEVTDGVTPNVSLLTKIIGQWQSNPNFCSAPGNPRSLTTNGAESEFAELVASVSVDISPYTILFGLEQAGAIERKGNTAELVAPVFLGDKDSKQGVEMLSEDCGDLIGCVENNLLKASKIPNLHLTTVYDNVCLEDLDKIREWILDQGTTFHERLRTFIGRYDKDANPRLYKREGGGRVAVCAFGNIEIKENKNDSKN